MRVSQRHLIWFLALGLAGLTAAVGLQPGLAPRSLQQAVIAAAALAAIFSLGVAGLALVRGRTANLIAPGIGAVVLSVVSLLCALRGAPQLASLGGLNACLTAGLLLRAVRLERSPPPPPAERDVRE